MTNTLVGWVFLFLKGKEEIQGLSRIANVIHQDHVLVLDVVLQSPNDFHRVCLLVHVVAGEPDEVTATLQIGIPEQFCEEEHTAIHEDCENEGSPLVFLGDFFSRFPNLGLDFLSAGEYGLLGVMLHY